MATSDKVVDDDASSWRLSRERTFSFSSSFFFLFLLGRISLSLSFYCCLGLSSLSTQLPTPLLYKERSTYAWSLKRMYTTTAELPLLHRLLPSVSLLDLFFFNDRNIIGSIRIVQHTFNTGRENVICFLCSSPRDDFLHLFFLFRFLRLWLG